MVDAAKEQCLSLLESVRDSYEQFKERGPPNRGGGDRGGYGGDRGGYGGGYGGDRGGDRQNSGSYGASGGYGAAANSYGGYGAQQAYGSVTPGYGGAQSPVAAQTPATPADPNEQKAQFEAWCQYYAANPTLDPYIQYGGYAAFVSQYMQGGYATTGTPDQSQMGNGAGAPPPPPPDDGSSAPPPPPGTGGGPPGAGYGYHSVPPPPGV